MDGVRESYIQHATVEKHKNDPEVQEVNKMWGKVWQAVIKAGQVGTALTAGQHFYQLVESTLKLTGHH